LIETIDLFKKGKILEGRQQLMQYISMRPLALRIHIDGYYDNLDLWGKTQEQKDDRQSLSYAMD